ncbi:hypothetical protein P7C73_g2908, partial [Tremellales sp. Uapishka_1]
MSSPTKSRSSQPTYPIATRSIAPKPSASHEKPSSSSTSSSSTNTTTSFATSDSHPSSNFGYHSLPTPTDPSMVFPAYDNYSQYGMSKGASGIVGSSYPDNSYTPNGMYSSLGLSGGYDNKSQLGMTGMSNMQSQSFSQYEAYQSPTYGYGVGNSAGWPQQNAGYANGYPSWSGNQPQSVRPSESFSVGEEMLTTPQSEVTPGSPILSVSPITVQPSMTLPDQKPVFPSVSYNPTFASGSETESESDDDFAADDPKKRRLSRLIGETDPEYALRQRRLTWPAEELDLAIDPPANGGKPKRGEKRKMQNRIAQRAFRARTKIHHIEVAKQMSQLKALTEAQAQRLDKLTHLVDKLQKENTALKADRWAHALGDAQAKAFAAAEQAKHEVEER